MNTQLVSFNAGEWSPWLDARTDLEKYASACRTLENLIVTPYGGVRRRPGFEYLGNAKFDGNTGQVKLIPFQFSTETTYMIEAGNLYMRFWLDGALVVDGADVPVEVVTPYLYTELRELQWHQVRDVVHFTHPNHEISRLLRTTATTFVFEEIEPVEPPLRDENIDPNLTLECSATSASGTMTATNFAPFVAGHVGSYWQLAHRRPNASVTVNITGNNTSPELEVLGSWTVTSYGAQWSADLRLQRSRDAGVTWETIRTWSGRRDRNISATGEEDTRVLMRLNIANWTNGTRDRAVLEADDGFVYGLVKVTAYVSTTEVDVDVIYDLYSTDPTDYWSEGSWSDYRGHPRAIAMHEQRLWLGGNEAQADTLWFSKIDAFDDFRVGTLDDDGGQFPLGSVEYNPVQWMISKGDKLIVGTAGAEYIVGSARTEDPITPENIRARGTNSAAGSKHLRAVVAGNSVIHVDISGIRLREVTYVFADDAWASQDLNILAEHIVQSPAADPQILDIAYQRKRDPIVWVITSPGTLAGMTYLREQNVVAWHRHTTLGAFESVAVLSEGAEDDELWCSVVRNIDGQIVRYIERMQLGYWRLNEQEDQDALASVDSYVTQTGAATAAISAPHLAAETVWTNADGAAQPAVLLDGAGNGTLQAPAVTRITGLPYPSLLRPMRLDAPLRDGSSQGREKRIHELVVRVYKSAGFEVSADGENWDLIEFRQHGDAMDNPVPLFTGDAVVPFDGPYSYAGNIWIRQFQPLPLTVLGIVAKWSVTGK